MFSWESMVYFRYFLSASPSLKVLRSAVVATTHTHNGSGNIVRQSANEGKKEKKKKRGHGREAGREGRRAASVPLGSP